MTYADRGPGADPRVVVRPAEPADAQAIAVVHVASWKAAYLGLLPAPYLDVLRPADRLAQWTRTLTVPPTGVRVLVAEQAGAMLGYASTGPCSEGDAGETGELRGLYLAPSAWRRGTGSRLLGAAVADLAADGYHDAILWVLPGNVGARAVYESQGWVDDGVERMDEVHGLTIVDRRYRRSVP